MFDYTMAAYQKTVNDCKKIAYSMSVILQIVYIWYLFYAIITSKGGLRFVNIVLCLLSVCYFLFFVLLTKFGKDIDAQKKSKIIKKIFIWCKRAIKLYTLGVMIFGVFQTAKTVKPFAVIFAVLMVVAFVLQIVFDILTYIVEKRLSLFVTAIMHDIKPITDTKRNVGNFFKKMAGKELEPEQLLSEQDVKNLEVLDVLVEKDLQQRREYKAAEKQRKKEEKQQLKEEKERQKEEEKQLAAAAKEEEKQLAIAAKEEKKAAKAAKKALPVPEETAITIEK